VSTGVAAGGRSYDGAMVWAFLLVCVVSLGTCAAGVWRARSQRGHAVGIAGIVVASLAITAVAATTHDPDVSGGRFAEGLMLAFVALGLVPLAVYYGLGASLARHRLILGGLWLITQVPLAYYALIAWIFVLDYVACTPDAYECPF
jgi:hypothetical protein